MHSKMSKIVAFVMALFSFAFIFAEEEIPEEKVFTIIDSFHEYNLNPQLANYSSDAQILTGLYEGLFSYDPQTLEPVPAIIESYKISRNKLRWSFVIRENAKFSNGEFITSSHVKDSWLKLLNPKMQAPFASLFDCIQGAKEYRTGEGKAEDVGIFIQSEKQFSVLLKTPAEHLDSILCHHSFSVVHSDSNVYSGAFVLESYENNVLTLKKNTEYYDAENVPSEIIKVIQSDDVKENAYLFNIGKVDWVISQIDINSVIDYKSIFITPEFATEYMFFKCDRFPWDREDFRNALLTAVPWGKLRSQAIVPAECFIYSLSNYKSPVGITETDSALAKAMLDTAKKTAGMAENKNPEIILAIADNDYMKAQAEILRTAWEAIGVKVKISKTPVERYLDSISGWKADIFSYTWIGDFADPLAFLELFRSDSSLNESSWVNPAYDSLLEKASQKTGAERMEILSGAEDVLLSDGVVLPISHPVTLNVLDKKAVIGWYVNALDIHPLKYLSKKKVDVYVPNLVMR
ncbi:MAG: peptide ABC transporter substrate-binding protein [Spirochaetaceae bacterium]|nr:peptide ABC transporter substrate-binding protein [Spirochaetaceae bacterium]